MYLVIYNQVVIIVVVAQLEGVVWFLMRFNKGKSFFWEYNQIGCSLILVAMMFCLCIRFLSKLCNGVLTQLWVNSCKKVETKKKKKKKIKVKEVPTKDKNNRNSKNMIDNLI
eukprot:TRINITY_DN49015_c0_g1_i3.p2 TRINITY_DN49015_c0_g1~~TRINITY_DN49015_c0_g1_i3.p2  ORF type:complete len:112 (-),score=8.61 TRINITY_DN49015_c0_g1_i3:62-397(-)